MIYRKENIFKVLDEEWGKSVAAVCITTNTTVKKDGCLVMGAGLAKEAASRWKFLPSEWGRQQKLLNHLCCEGELLKSYCFERDLILLGLPTKRDWRESSTIEYITQCCYELSVFYYNNIHFFSQSTNKILIPKLGCANGGLDWKEVQQVMEANLPITGNFVVCLNEE